MTSWPSCWFPRAGRDMTSVLESGRRSFKVAGAFFRLGLQQELSYPLGFVTNQLSAVIPAFIFYFVAQSVDRPDYFTFVLVGLIGSKFLDAGMRGFSTEIDVAINRGWLEMFLAEPVHWRMLPISMVQWRNVQSAVNVGVLVLIGMLLGARFNWSQLPTVALIVLFAFVAGLAIGTLSASLKVLAKSGDPILFVYGLAAQVFGGVFFPVDTLPAQLRWISWLVPHTYVVTAMRGALTPGTSVETTLATGHALLALLVFCAVLFPVSLWLYGKALQYGRKLGVLGGY